MSALLPAPRPVARRYDSAVGYYYERPPSTDDEPPRPGCLETLIITRAVFGVLLWPVLALFAVFIDVGLIFWLFTVHPALALLPVAATVAALWLFGRWDQQRHRPPGL
jgi:hypothetical protein